MIGLSWKNCLLVCALSFSLAAAPQSKQQPLYPSEAGSVPRPKPASVGVAYASTLWPQVGGVATVYYYVEPTSGDTANLSTAVSTFNGDFSNVIQWVQLDSVGSGSPNYVDVNFDSGDFSGQCEANEGYEAVQGQPMGGSAACTVTTLLHEMGHVIGLWHEQSRSDRDTYITLNYSNVIKGSWGNFAVVTDNQQLLTPYDYASVMQYPSFTDSRNGGPVIETIPPGIPLQGTDGIPANTTADYSAADKEAILRLYGAAPTAVTVTSNPVGLQVKVDGVTITTPQIYNWALNSTHTLSVPSGVQTLTGDIADSTTTATFYYKYGRWNDSTSLTHTITVAPGDGSPAFPSTSPQVATYSANFIQLVPYTAAVYPDGEGSVTANPVAVTYGSGSFFVARQKEILTASPVSGWNFYEFNNAPFWLPGGLGANPKIFYVPDTGNPVDTTAEFSNTPVFTFTTSPNAFSSNLSVYVDGNFWYAPKNFSAYYDNYPGSDWSFGSQHTIAIGSPEYPYSINSRYAFSKWSDGGAISHSIQVPAANASYIATLTPQFAPATNFDYPPCGGSASLSPASPTGDGFYNTGTNLQFSATPDSGWTFAGWTYDLTGTANPASLTASDETLVFANFNITNAPLTLTSLSPAAARAGTGTFTLTLNGTGFSPQSLVWVDGQYPAVTYVSSTELQVTVPAADVASPTAFQVYVENFPSGWDGCAVFGYATFIVEGPPATPPITWKNPAAIPYGTALSATQLNATSTVAGTFAYTPAAGTVLTVGTHTLSVTFTPTDTFDYTTTTATVSITVNKATPSITWPTPSPITYGTALSSTQLDATSPVVGTFVYTPHAPTVLLAGSHTLSVTFTPTDTTDYKTATNTTTLVVNPATLTVTANHATRLYGVANPTFTATYTGFVHGDTKSVLSGSPSLTTTATTSSPVGTYTITAAQGTLSAANYVFTFVNGTLAITQATPVITWATPSPITYGTALSATQLDATSPVAGTFVYTPHAPTVLGVGSRTLSVTLTPTDTTDYKTTSKTVTLVVNPATLTVTANNASRAFGDANPTFTDTITGFVHGDTKSVVSGSASLTTTATQSSPPGTYPIVAAQGTLSAANYTFTFVNGTLTVN